MEPTKEIIELSRKIHDLGHIGSVKWGDWFFLQDGIVLCAYATKGFHEWAEAAEDVEHFPIISLEDGLEWLNENDQFYILSGLKDGAVIRTYSSSVTADTPHEAVLKAMVKVLEEKP